MFYQLKIWLGILLLDSFVLHDGVAPYKTYFETFRINTG